MPEYHPWAREFGIEDCNSQAKGENVRQKTCTEECDVGVNWSSLESIGRYAEGSQAEGRKKGSEEGAKREETLVEESGSEEEDVEEELKSQESVIKDCIAVMRG